MSTFPLQAHGLSGQLYTFTVANLGHSFGTHSGVYVLVGRQGLGGMTALYVGQTADASQRPGPFCSGHHVEASARRMGLAAIGFIAVADQWRRNAIERDLIQGLNPPLNVQHRNSRGAA